MTQAYSPFPTVDNGRPARRVLAILARLLLILALLVPWASSGAARLRQRPPGLMVTPIPAALTPGNENWASGFIAPGLNGEVNAVVVGPDGSLYVGGNFTIAGGVAANNIARWDGSAQSPLGSGIVGIVRAVAFGPDGSLYAGGFFTKAGGASASNIARWNGSAWSPLGSGMDTPVNALALGSDGSLYAGGTFSTAGNKRADYFGQWTAAVGRCDLAVDVPTTFYPANQPVTITVRTAGTLGCVSIQRVNRSHPNATLDVQTGAFWQIIGTTAAGAPASGFSVDMTLPTSMSDDNVCRWTGSAWDCALSSVAPGALIRTGVTAFSPWAVGYAAIADLSASNNGPTTPGSATTLSASITRGSVVTYTWVFGDGTTGSGQNPSHTYAAVGSYTATATATNASGSSSASTTVIVQYRMYIPGLFYNPVGAPARR